VVFEQFYLSCLAHASYLVGDQGEAVVVDPQRDVDQYIEAARAKGLSIRYVLETHLHADFVSGHRELAERTGATIVLGARAGATFPHRAVKDGEQLTVGRVRITVLETPGHTPEGVCYLVEDGGDPSAPARLLTGDTLFVGDVGRPDLVTSKGFTDRDMAGMLYDSLHRKILRLPDATGVWPAHGAGSACGKNIGKELHSTLGDQRRFNPNLAPMTREAFITQVTTDLAPAPEYFGFDAETNRTGALPLADLPAPPPLTPAEVEAAQAQGAIVLDVREGVEFCAGHVPGSRNIGLAGTFAPWAGALLPVHARIVLVAEDLESVRAARLRLARVGIENVTGYLDGGLAEWARVGRPVASFETVTPPELAARLAGGGAPDVIDVRRRGEYEDGHVPGARLEPLAPRLAPTGLDPARPLAVVCQSGYRSVIAASFLAEAHPGPILNLAGGTLAWREAGLPFETGAPAPR
jgi:glyoxylase-like metal-dependent hydrolase (beta-lactamase superfamily II)/rhodanese-related sulfurtransferase